MRRQAGTVARATSQAAADQIAAERRFWEENRNLWRERGLAQQSQQEALAEQLQTVEGNLQNQQQPEQPTVIPQLAGDAQQLDAESTALRNDVVGTPVEAPATTIDPNRLHHIFDNADHNLGGVVSQFGSQQAAYHAMELATQAAVDAQGIRGVFEISVQVGQQMVTVRGNVVGGVARIGTAFIP
jgi:hypothetical protein